MKVDVGDSTKLADCWKTLVGTFPDHSAAWANEIRFAFYAGAEAMFGLIEKGDQAAIDALFKEIQTEHRTRLAGRGT